MSTTLEPIPRQQAPLAPRKAGTDGSRPRHAPFWRRWSGVPRRGDPRLPFAAILTSYTVLGTVWLGFNRSPAQILLTVVAGCALDMLLHYVLRERTLLVPLSAYISALSIAILLNYAHDDFLLFFPIFLTIGSKYLFTIDGKHHFNPSLFGVAGTLLLAGHLISAAPAYQWGGTWAMSAFIVSAALALFVFRIGRGWLITSFLLFYALQTALRAWIMRAHLPAEMLFLGTLTSPPFYLFTFFMLTDPKTSPATPRQQVGVAFAIALVDLILHKFGSVFTFFYAAFAVAWARFFWLHARRLVAAWRRRGTGRPRWSLGALLRTPTSRAGGVLGALALVGGTTYRGLVRPHVTLHDAGFTLQPISSTQSGISVIMDPSAFDLVDPRLRHISKWLLSVGASVESADVDGDGLVDLLFTNPLARPEDRVQLYLNRGDFRFERVHVPALEEMRGDPRDVGLPSGALFFDYDGDGDEDLLLLVSFGRPRLFQNLLKETGRLAFRDVTTEAGMPEYVVSVAANVIDYDRDGRPDLLIANAINPYLDQYPDSTRLSIFRLPAPAFPGDRRMFHFMHNGWHNADNGGRNILLHNLGRGRFESVDVAAMGMPETHWSLAIGTGDLNGDGWTDLYVASDFGHDDLYLNEKGRHFRRVEGKLFGDVGRDTYKGMNSSIADFDGDGRLDVYVSDVHHALQAEGSLLWMNHGTAADGTPDLRDEASARGALNEDRFGWGAGVGDLANNGWLDIVQANGMVDDRLDHRYADCPDYWYVNHKLMQATSEIHTYADMWGDLRGRCIYPNEPRRVYFNRGAGARPQFTDVASLVGLTQGDNSRGVAIADLDNDGRLDVVIANQHGAPALFRNVPTASGRANRWLGLRLVGDGRTCSRDAFGSRVTLVIPGEPDQIREVQAANGFSAQSDTRIHFGLGLTRQDTVAVRVRWCGGEERSYRVGDDAYHTLVE
jgi:hypothetical protein